MLIVLFWLKVVFNEDGDRFFVIYVNYLIINKIVLVLIYGDEND